MSYLPENFVYLSDIDPSIIIDKRYYDEYNFIGRKVKGYYANEAPLTREAAFALKKIQERAKQDGYSLIVYEAYRPRKAGDDMWEWAQNITDQKMKHILYPEIDKKDFFDLGFVAKESSHNRGSTVDVSLIRLEDVYSPVPSLKYRELAGKNLPFFDDGSIDMGTSFDFMGDESATYYKTLPDYVVKNRKYLVELMKLGNFLNYGAPWGDYPKEWWHFTLIDEPHPNTYFDFDIRR